MPEGKQTVISGEVMSLPIAEFLLWLTHNKLRLFLGKEQPSLFADEVTFVVTCNGLSRVQIFLDHDDMDSFNFVETIQSQDDECRLHIGTELWEGSIKFPSGKYNLFWRLSGGDEHCHDVDLVLLGV